MRIKRDDSHRCFTRSGQNGNEKVVFYGQFSGNDEIAAVTAE